MTLVVFTHSDPDKKQKGTGKRLSMCSFSELNRFHSIVLVRYVAGLRTAQKL